MSSSESEAENPPEDITEERQQQEKSFEDLGLDDALRERCEALGWKKPTKIQVEAIPVALEVGRYYVPIIHMEAFVVVLGVQNQSSNLVGLFFHWQKIFNFFKTVF